MVQQEGGLKGEPPAFPEKASWEKCGGKRFRPDETQETIAVQG